MRRIIAPLAIGLPLLALFVSLGFWQLDRADEKRALAARFEAGAVADAVAVAAPADLAAAADHSRVEARGRYVPGRQVLLDAQTHRGRAGYRVWTPLELDAGGWIVVDRGWVEAPPDRGVLPDVAVDADARTVRGIRAPLPRPGIRVGAPDAGDGAWPRRLVWPDAAALAAAFGRDVPDALLLLAPTEPDGYARDWDPVGPMPPERHVGYAVQWFSLATALVVIALVLVMRMRRNG